MLDFLPLFSGALLLSTFAILAVLEMYLFMAQRSALEIARESSLDPRVSRLMLPLWYALNWPLQLAKWGLLLLILRSQGWLIALACLAVPFFASVFAPIPHRHFIPKFRRRLARDLASGLNMQSSAEVLMAVTVKAKRLELE